MNDNQNTGKKNFFFVKLEAIFQKKVPTGRDPFFFSSDLNAIKIEKRHLKYLLKENFF